MCGYGGQSGVPRKNPGAPCVVGLEGLHVVVYLLRRAVVVRIGQVGKPSVIQLIVCCHIIYVFCSLIK